METELSEMGLSWGEEQAIAKDKTIKLLETQRRRR